MTTIGVISDTHGLLRPQAIQALAGSDLILHAGDAGKPDVLAALGEIAPLVAVRGNIDRGESALALPSSQVIELEGVALYLLHDIQDLDLDPQAAGFRAVIYGHSHQPSIREENGVLYLNPGSAGPRRFKLPVSLARITLLEGTLKAQLVALEV